MKNGWSVSSKLTIRRFSISSIVTSAYVPSGRRSSRSIANPISINVFLLHIYQSFTFVCVFHSFLILTCWLTEVGTISSGQNSCTQLHAQSGSNPLCSVPDTDATSLPFMICPDAWLLFDSWSTFMCNLITFNNTIGINNGIPTLFRLSIPILWYLFRDVLERSCSYFSTPYLLLVYNTIPPNLIGILKYLSCLITVLMYNRSRQIIFQILSAWTISSKPSFRASLCLFCLYLLRILWHLVQHSYPSLTFVHVFV